MPVTKDFQILERVPEQVLLAELAGARAQIVQLRTLLTRKRNEIRLVLAYNEQLLAENANLEDFAQRCAGAKYEAEARVMVLEAELAKSEK